MTKQTGLISFAVVAMLLVGTVAMAQPGYGRGGQGCPGGFGPATALTPEQQAKAEEIAKDFQDKTETLRRDIYAKSLELEAQMIQDKPDAKKIDALAGDINEMRGQLYKHRIEFRKRMSAEVGVNIPMGRGGRGARGYGQGGDCPYTGAGAGGPGGRGARMGRGQGGCGACPQYGS